MSAATERITSKSQVEKIADAVLYEGYILYPYRPSAVKNQRRWNFGVLCPESYAQQQGGTESAVMQTECLLEAESDTTISVQVRFLHLMQREVAEAVDCQQAAAACGHLVDERGDHFKVVPFLQLGGKVLQPWQEAVEREVTLPRLKGTDLGWAYSSKFIFPECTFQERLAETSAEPAGGLLLRTQPALTGAIDIRARILDTQTENASRKLIRLAVAITNLTAFADAEERSRDDALMHSLVSTHTILSVEQGNFVSLLDPPDVYKAAATECVNTGTFPVLVGDEGDLDCVLSSPIILYDYPQIAPESAGNLFDGTEIDEILTLRIMSLSDDEKREMRDTDALARQLLERTETISAEQLMKLHGMMKKG